jgi:hypothetical protein
MGYNTPKQTVSQFQLKGRYARQYLSFAGKSSKDFLLYLSGPGVYDSPAADVESTSVPGRNGDIITENARTGRRRYQNVDIKYKAFFFNGLPAKTQRSRHGCYLRSGIRNCRTPTTRISSGWQSARTPWNLM